MTRKHSVKYILAMFLVFGLTSMPILTPIASAESSRGATAQPQQPAIKLSDFDREVQEATQPNSDDGVLGKALLFALLGISLLTAILLYLRMRNGTRT